MLLPPKENFVSSSSQVITNLSCSRDFISFVESCEFDFTRDEECLNHTMDLIVECSLGEIYHFWIDCVIGIIIMLSLSLFMFCRVGHFTSLGYLAYSFACWCKLNKRKSDWLIIHNLTKKHTHTHVHTHTRTHIHMCTNRMMANLNFVIH